MCTRIKVRCLLKRYLCYLYIHISVIYLLQQSPLIFVNFDIFGTVMPEEIGVHIMRFLHGRMQV